jgi:hypothetical protein
MAGIWNAGTRYLRIVRVGLLNVQTAAVTGVICVGEVRKMLSVSAWTPASASTPIAHATGDSALSSVTCGRGGTPTIGGSTLTLRRYIWSSDEPAASTATSDEWECLIPLNIIWDAGYGDSGVQRLELYTNEMFAVYNTSGAAGLVDIWIEFTDEAS